MHEFGLAIHGAEVIERGSLGVHAHSGWMDMTNERAERVIQGDLRQKNPLGRNPAGASEPRPNWGGCQKLRYDARYSHSIVAGGFEEMS